MIKQLNVKNLGIVNTEPNAYVQLYGSSLIKQQQTKLLFVTIVCNGYIESHNGCSKKFVRTLNVLPKTHLLYYAKLYLHF